MTGLQILLTGLTAAALAASVVVTAVAGARAAPGEPVVVIVAPWGAADAVVRSAGGLVIAAGRLPFAAAAYDPAPDFAARLSRHGALAVLPDRFAAALCRHEPEER